MDPGSLGHFPGCQRNVVASLLFASITVISPILPIIIYSKCFYLSFFPCVVGFGEGVNWGISKHVHTRTPERDHAACSAG